MTIKIDFTTGAIAHRTHYGGGKNQLLAKAMGLHKQPSLSIIDSTAGLGRDAFILASLGCHVTLIERNPTIHTALQHALIQAKEHGLEAASRMQLIEKNSIDFLSELQPKDYPDVIYCDPMYPPSKKSRLVKQAMRDLKDIVGDDLDADQLFRSSLGRAKNRIVVKRPRHAKHINQQQPNFSYDGKSSRFDIYLM